jgi:hypothetical protein
MTIAILDFLCSWAEAISMATYLKTSFLLKYLHSSTTPFEFFDRNRFTIAHLKLFGYKCYIYIYEEEHCRGSKYHSRTPKVKSVGIISASNIYLVAP